MEQGGFSPFPHDSDATPDRDMPTGSVAAELFQLQSSSEVKSSRTDILLPFDRFCSG